MQKKKIIILIGIILGIILIIWGFTILFKPVTTNQTQINEQTTGTNFFSNLFPFINTIGNTTEKVLDILGIGDEAPTEEQISLLEKVSSFPIAGYGIFYKERFVELPEMSPAPILNSTAQTETPEEIIITPPTEIIPILKYTEKTTGTVYQTDVNEINEKEVSSNTIPVVHESFFAGNGESVIMRYLQGANTIETFIKTLPREILGGDTIENLQNPGTFLPENITNISISPDGSQIFYLFNSQNNAIGITAMADGNNKAQVFVSPFTEWLSQWPNDRMITLTTKPSSTVPGYMYAVDPVKKDFNKVLGGINGLTTLTSPNGKLVLYNTSDLSLFLYNTETGNSQSLRIKTLPEKCVWGLASDSIYCAVPRYIPTGNYPDSWYQGEVSFSDQFWYIDVFGTNALLAFDPIDLGGEETDAINLSLDSSQDYLFFLNKKDSSFWKFDL